MSTIYPDFVYRSHAVGTKPGGTDTPAILPMPDGVVDLTLFASADAATSCKVEETYSSAAEISGNTATWMSVDSTLDSVGTTGVRFLLGQRTPTAFRVTSLTNDKNASLVLTGKRVR